MTAALKIRGLRKSYGRTVALDGLDVTVPKGVICGFVGPNGAGKTTAVRILTTLSKATEGRASVAGFDVATQPTEVRRRIGLAAIAIERLQHRQPIAQPPGIDRQAGISQ